MRNARIPMMLILALCVSVGRWPNRAYGAPRRGENRDQRQLRSERPSLGTDGGCLLKRGMSGGWSSECFCGLRSMTTTAIPAAPQDSSSSVTRPGATTRHTSWSSSGDRIHVKNEGGRLHTFTPVAQFGGGRVEGINVGAQVAPECALPTPPATDRYEVPPGERLRLKADKQGIQRFQCCIHAWMRATVRVTPEKDHHHDDR